MLQIREVLMRLADDDDGPQRMFPGQRVQALVDKG